MNEINVKIKELRNKIAMLEEELEELEEMNSNWYIGVYSIGDGDYWDEYYCRLGYISAERAKAWVDETLDDGVYEARYFDVTREVYDKFGDWFNLDNLLKSINKYNTAIRNLEGVGDFESTVTRAIEDLAKEINIKFLSFQHPAN